jgi:succinate dehydrogenase / fumarate reductase iron-sulfur subunit
MAEFFLPANSKVGKDGRTFKAAAGAKHVRVFKIYRFDPDTAGNPRIDSYEIDMDSCGPMVLDALIKIKNEIDSTLTFRRSCREGICGSCAMNIDGRTGSPAQRLRRRERRHQDLSAAAPAGDQGFGARPHRLLCPVRLDQALAADPDSGAARRRTAAVQGGPGKGRSAVRLHPVRLLFDELSELLVEQRPLPGPAALLAAYRWIVDSRDEATGERLDQLEDPFRLYRCHTIMNCTEACPKDLNPAKAIGEIKQMMAQRVNEGLIDGPPEQRREADRQAALALPARDEGVRPAAAPVCG